MQLEQKLIVITGSGRGIGRAMALAFAAKHANVAPARSQ
jgi:NAD(P)-dependent dehydrogenase (short-subunit alcohol dehydrogenase family)